MRHTQSSRFLTSWAPAASCSGAGRVCLTALAATAAPPRELGPGLVFHPEPVAQHGLVALPERLWEGVEGQVGEVAR